MISLKSSHSSPCSTGRVPRYGEIVDMPDRRVALFVRLCMQNGGRLSVTKRHLFAELDDVEVAAMQAAIGDALAETLSC